MLVPKIIHQIWFQGQAEVPADYAEQAAALQRMNPTWRYRLWDDAALQGACRTVGRECYERYMSFQHLHQKVDLGRYVVLFLQGGISVDMDVIPLNPLDNLPGLAGARFMVSRVHINPAETYIFTMGRLTVLYNNAMILSSPAAPHLRNLIDDVVQTRHGQAALTKVGEIQRTTGPQLFTESLMRTGMEGVTVLDNKYFEPCYGKDVHCTPPRDGILYHKHAASWVPVWLQSLSVGWYAAKPYAPLVALVLLLLLWTSKGKLVHRA
jgi:hypothetical protein